MTSVDAGASVVDPTTIIAGEICPDAPVVYMACALICCIDTAIFGDPNTCRRFHFVYVSASDPIGCSDGLRGTFTPRALFYRESLECAFPSARCLATAFGCVTLVALLCSLINIVVAAIWCAEAVWASFLIFRRALRQIAYRTGSYVTMACISIGFSFGMIWLVLRIPVPDAEVSVARFWGDRSYLSSLPQLVGLWARARTPLHYGIGVPRLDCYCYDVLGSALLAASASTTHLELEWGGADISAEVFSTHVIPAAVRPGRSASGNGIPVNASLSSGSVMVAVWATCCLRERWAHVVAEGPCGGLASTFCHESFARYAVSSPGARGANPCCLGRVQTLQLLCVVGAVKQLPDPMRFVFSVSDILTLCWRGFGCSESRIVVALVLAHVQRVWFERSGHFVVTLGGVSRPGEHCKHYSG